MPPCPRFSILSPTHSPSHVPAHADAELTTLWPLGEWEGLSSGSRRGPSAAVRTAYGPPVTVTVTVGLRAEGKAEQAN
jgi:hypothetical protein